jgi:hypothetical protein
MLVNHYPAAQCAPGIDIAVVAAPGALGLS